MARKVIFRHFKTSWRK